MNISINGENFMTVCVEHKEAYFDWCPICFSKYEEDLNVEIEVNVDFGYMKGLELAEGKGWIYAQFHSWDSRNNKVWRNVGKLGGIEWDGEDDPVEEGNPYDRIVDTGNKIIIYYGNGKYHQEGDWTEITETSSPI